MEVLCSDKFVLYGMDIKSFGITPGVNLIKLLDVQSTSVAIAFRLKNNSHL